MSCHQPKERQPETKARRESKYDRLLTKFKDIRFDTLEVYSPEELTGEYKGVALDSSDAVLFPADIAQQHFNEPPGLFAVYQFPISDKVLGLIARTPSEYVPSSIKLFFLDKEKDSITSYKELAENWGDAGDVSIKTAWLLKDRQQKLKTFIWVQESHYNSVDDEQDTTIQQWNYYYLLRLSGKGADTVSQDEKQLEREFSRLLKR